MASTAAVGNKTTRPSFAKIAAAGIKPPNVQQSSNSNSASNMHSLQTAASPSEDRIPSSHPDATNAQSVNEMPQKLAHFMPNDSPSESTNQPLGNNIVLSASQAHDVKRVEQSIAAADERLIPTSSDGAGTRVSSSNDSTKPASLDGRSITSGTTFALDEKESLRPDDSASVKAVDDEDGIPGSDDGIKAFRDQLREINVMDRSRRSGSGVYTPGVNAKGVLYVPPPGSSVGVRPETTQVPPQSIGSGDIAPDPKLLEALESPRDRIWVLKLEQDIIDFVKDPKEPSLDLPQCNSFYRMLAHKIADYYMLGHLVDDSASAVRLHKTPHCRIPPPLTGITTPSTAASTPPPSGPQLKILRRGDGTGLSNGSNMTSKTTSEAGESGEDDKKQKAPQSREEREARYEAARLRIMGSARPSESPEAMKEKEESRTSSTTGKKAKKSKRTNSDDDFEPRTNFNSYFSNGNSTPTFVQEPAAASNPGSTYAGYNSQGGVDLQPFQQGAQGFQSNLPPESNWQYPLYSGGDAPNAWAPPYQPPYDLSTDFQRSMNFSQPAYQGGGPMQYTQESGGFGQPSYGQQMWPQQSHPPPIQQAQSQMPQGFPQAFSPRPSTSTSQAHNTQPYLYGQLPSQAFPGRQPNKLEHPLPGSYKGQHFNPQSQTFVPGQANSPSFQPRGALQRTVSNSASYNPTFALSSPAQRQAMTQAQPSVHASPQVANNAPLPARYPSQPMTHPLPQPVFPRQPSPALPLPPKPQSFMVQYSGDQQSGTPPSNSNSTTHQGTSTMSSWGVPSSLPAKPPPSRVSNGSMPTFGMMPHMNGGAGPYTNGQQ